MEITTYSNFRQNLKAFLDKVLTDHTPLFITRAKGEDVVVMSKADYDSIQETFYLLKNPANAMHLLESLKELNKGKGMEKDLIDL
jgi:antitoxin YefM